jgi:hypothetical protein
VLPIHVFNSGNDLRKPCPNIVGGRPNNRQPLRLRAQWRAAALSKVATAPMTLRPPMRPGKAALVVLISDDDFFRIRLGRAQSRAAAAKQPADLIQRDQRHQRMAPCWRQAVRDPSALAHCQQRRRGPTWPAVTRLPQGPAVKSPMSMWRPIQNANELARKRASEIARGSVCSTNVAKVVGAAPKSSSRGGARS